LYLQMNSRRAIGAAFAMSEAMEFFAEKRRMKATTVLSLLMIALSGYAASAAEFHNADYDEITVLSVTPRSAAVKPYVMAIYTKEQQERVAAAFKRAPLKPGTGREG